MTVKYFSMFSGIGGFEVGINNAAKNLETQFECVGYSEIDKHAIQTYESHFSHEPYGSATDIDPATIPAFDLLVGGFPCQAFSIAGKRKGFDDTRGTLFFDIARILRHHRPANFILENVKGLISHDAGRTFRTIITTLTELGYSVEWQVLNSKNFGVPQSRERIYIVGHYGNERGQQVFPLTVGTANNLEEITQGVSDGQRIYRPLLARTLKALGGGQGALTGMYVDDAQALAVTRKKVDGEVTFTERKQSTCIDASYGKGFDNHGQRTGFAYESDLGLAVRRLTPVETERLQGFPDNWTSGSDTQRYRRTGNAVTTNVVQAVVERIYAPKKATREGGL